MRQDLAAKVGWRFLGLGFLGVSRRHEELRQANQSDAALAIEAELVRTRPWDTDALTRYARNLANSGEVEAATTVLESALKAPDNAWQPYGLSNLRNTLLDVFARAGWHDRQVTFLAPILARKDAEVDAQQCQHYLTALLRAEREAEADATATAWLAPVLAGAELTPAIVTRATAAARYMVGESAIDRLEAAHAYGRILGSNDRSEAGIEILVGALDEYRQTRGGRLNDAANPAISSLIRLCEMCSHYAQGEAWLRAELERPANAVQREALVETLCTLYEWAVGHDGETALGRGQGLYEALNREITVELAKPGRPQHLRNLVTRYCAVARVAKNRTLDGVASG